MSSEAPRTPVPPHPLLVAIENRLVAMEEQLLEMEVAIDARLTALENLEAEQMAAALATIGDSLQLLGKNCQALDQRLAALEKWRKAE